MIKEKTKYEVYLVGSKVKMHFHSNSRDAYKYLKQAIAFDECVINDNQGIEVSRAVRVQGNEGKSMIMRGAWK